VVEQSVGVGDLVPAGEAVNGAWMSKVRFLVRADVAHFIGETGKAACESIVCRDGKPRLAPFACGWIARRPESRTCRDCQRVLAKAASVGLSVRVRTGE
jgi:hypothetical protein